MTHPGYSYIPPIVTLEGFEVLQDIVIDPVMLQVQDEMKCERDHDNGAKQSPIGLPISLKRLRLERRRYPLKGVARILRTVRSAKMDHLPSLESVECIGIQVYDINQLRQLESDETLEAVGVSTRFIRWDWRSKEVGGSWEQL